MRVPDDASALEADRQAWVDEQRARRRRHRLRRLVLTRRWERFGLSGPLVVIALVLTAGVGALASVFVPRPRTPPPAAAPLAPAARVEVPPAGAVPVATATVERAGDRLGRRLPDAALAGDVAPLRADDLRPAVVVLVPPGCACTASVDVLYAQAREFRLTTWLVGPGGPGADGTAATRRALDALDTAAAAGGARWAVDTEAVLSRAFAARGLTVALVRPDGVLAVLLRDLPRDGRGLPAMEIALAGLVPRG